MLETPKAIGTCKRNNPIDVTMGNQQQSSLIRKLLRELRSEVHRLDGDRVSMMDLSVSEEILRYSQAV